LEIIWILVIRHSLRESRVRNRGSFILLCKLHCKVRSIQYLFRIYCFVMKDFGFYFLHLGLNPLHLDGAELFCQSFFSLIVFFFLEILEPQIIILPSVKLVESTMQIAGKLIEFVFVFVFLFRVNRLRKEPSVFF